MVHITNQCNLPSIHLCEVSADLECPSYKFKWSFGAGTTELRSKSLLTTNASFWQHLSMQTALICYLKALNLKQKHNEGKGLNLRQIEKPTKQMALFLTLYMYIYNKYTHTYMHVCNFLFPVTLNPLNEAFKYSTE